MLAMLARVHEGCGKGGECGTAPTPRRRVRDLGPFGVRREVYHVGVSLPKLQRVETGRPRQNHGASSAGTLIVKRDSRAHLHDVTIIELALDSMHLLSGGGA